MDGEEINPRWQEDDLTPLFGPPPDSSPTPGEEASIKNKLRAIDLIIGVSGLNYCEGNAVKSIFQYNSTGNVDNLREAQYYIGALIDAHTCIQPDLPPDRFPDMGLE